jgi:hypothetical protein
MLGLLLLGLVPAGAQEGGCKPYTQKTFPLGTVWWKPDPARAAGESHPDARAEYLVIGVHPDGILIQNKESRSPRLLGWAIVARAFVSLDGRRSWQRGCQR